MMAAKKLTPAQAEALSKSVSRTTSGTGMGSRTPTPRPKPKTQTKTQVNQQTVLQQPTVQQPAQTVSAQQQYTTWEQAAKELYGGYYTVIDSVPEIQDLLKRAFDGKWSDSRFEYELRQTSWWKQNSATTREWDLASQTDPATAQQQIINRTEELRSIAGSQFGVQIGEAQLQKLAKDSLRFGWTQQMVMNAIGLEATRTSGMSDLASGFVGQGLKQTANAYGLRLSDDMFNRWTTAIATGQETKERFQQYALNSAKNLFPAIAQQLDNGLTFQQIVDPFRNTASQILEIAPESIDFTDPKWARAISTVDKNGQQRMMSFSEWGDYLRTDRSFGYEYTSDAQQRAYKVANDLANLFGKV